MAVDREQGEYSPSRENDQMRERNKEFNPRAKAEILHKTEDF